MTVTYTSIVPVDVSVTLAFAMTQSEIVGTLSIIINFIIYLLRLSMIYDANLDREIFY